MIDAIYTGAGGGLCCMAVGHGFGYGINSANARQVCCRHTTAGHQVLFVDNPFRKYNHERHVAVIQQFRPRYATARDVMNIDDLPAILDQAEEIAEYAEQVIIIPKCDCVDRIPEKFMVGYATPTSYGGTSLPYSAFSGRRVHLLGGAWAQLRQIMTHSGMNVVSFDFNRIHKLAVNGIFIDPNGYEYRMAHAMPSFSNRPMWTCMALSFAAIRKGVDDVIQVCHQRAL